MLRKLGLSLLLVIVLVVAIVYGAGLGLFGSRQDAGSPTARAIDAAFIAEKEKAVHEAALDVGVARPKQILFGDLHVHSTFSFDAFTLSLPMTGGDGAHPVSDACDFARHCSSLDFWSINDHAITLTPRRWAETVDAIRQCNELAGSESNPDLVTYLGWEWTQVGATPETHYGHKNVVIRGLDDDEIPTRPIAAGAPLGIKDIQKSMPSPMLMGAYGLYDRKRGGLDFVAYQAELMGVESCPDDVPVRDLPSDCRESAVTPGDLFAKLDDWGFDSLVIPHGTTWGFYTPLGSSWDKQLTLDNHDPDRQKLVEVFSGPWTTMIPIDRSSSKSSRVMATRRSIDLSKRSPLMRTEIPPAPHLRMATCPVAGALVRSSNRAASRKTNRPKNVLIAPREPDNSSSKRPTTAVRMSFRRRRSWIGRTQVNAPTVFSPRSTTGPRVPCST